MKYFDVNGRILQRGLRLVPLDWPYLTKDSSLWRAVVSTVMNIWVL
jgi:hypothetical protein